MVKNATKNTIIWKDFSVERGLSKARGLIGNGSKKAILLRTRFGIHTFLLKEGIDVIILDENKRAVVIKKNLKPNRIFLWNVKYDMVLELPKGSVEKSKTEKGDSLEFVS